MANTTHKGSEFNNISETWDQNEKRRNSGSAPANDAFDETAPAAGLEQVIKQEAAEYDTENKEDQLLSGDRATLNDNVDADDSGE